MQMILNENVKAVSNGALQQLDLDLVQCEQFAASEPIQGLEVNRASSRRGIRIQKYNLKINV